jgi:hypothetical protein
LTAAAVGHDDCLSTSNLPAKRASQLRAQTPVCGVVAVLPNRQDRNEGGYGYGGYK